MISIHESLCFLLFIVALGVTDEKSSPILNALSLITCFFIIGVLLFFFDADFLALTFIVVYVGGIAVLFLFVVMMMDVKMNLEESFDILGLFFFFSFILDFFFSITISIENLFFQINDLDKENYIDFEEIFNNEPSLSFFNSLTNTDTLGQMLFNYYPYYFLLVGLILLIALIGAILLTLDFNTNLQKSQLSFKQLSRSDRTISFLNFYK